AWIQYGGGGALWEELFARYNIKAFIGGGSGVQAGGWFSKEINSLSDMAGLRMRIAGYGGEVLARVGGTPVSLPADKLVTELYSGALDAAEWNGPYADLDFGFAKLLPYYVQPGFHEPGATEFIGVNQQFWQGLTTRERAIVEYASRAEAAFTLGQFRAENGRALKQLVTEYGARVWAMPQDVWLQAARMSEEIVAEKADVDDLGRRIYRSYIRFRAEIAPWSSTSLEAYALARQRAFSAT
ncbi:MAG: ABC transporter substrate-binding protein, partial [Pseudomonadota bacterium]